MPEEPTSTGETDGTKDGNAENDKQGNGSTSGETKPGGSGDVGASAADIPTDVKTYIDSKFDALSELIQGQGGEKTGTPRRVDLQEEARKMVEQASQRLEADKEHAAAHAKLDQKETEKPPIKQSRAQRFLFGKIDE